MKQLFSSLAPISEAFNLSRSCLGSFLLLALLSILEWVWRHSRSTEWTCARRFISL